MKVAIFSQTLDIGNGYGNITVELCSALHCCGVDFTLFLPKSQQEAVSRLEPVFETRCILPEPFFRIVQPKAWGFFRPIDLSGFDLVHSLFAFPYCVLAARSAKRAGLPFIMGLQGTYGVLPLTYFPEKYLLKWAYGRAKVVTAPSVYSQDKVQEYARKEYPMRVIHNGVNFERFRRDVSMATLREFYEGKKILLTVGGLKGRKGQDLVIRALPEIRKQNENVRYLMVGPLSSKEGLQNLAKENGVSDLIEFVGPKTGDELIAYFRLCDVYVHTPRADKLNFEGFGIVYLEAGACGKAVVATDAGGIRDAVLDGETGIVCEPEDVDSIAEAVNRLLEDDDLCIEMGEKGLSYAKKHDWNTIAKEWKNLYSTPQ